MIEKYPKLNIGFIVLCPDNNIGCLNNTVKSIKREYPGSPYIAVIGEGWSDKDIKEAKEICTTYIGKRCMTSLINKGMSKAPADWNMCIIAGTWVRKNLDKKFGYFLKDRKDIFFPVVDRKINFVDGTINGLTIHKDTFKEVGNFGIDNAMEICKLFWALDAVDKGCKFKAIVGAKIC